MKNPLKPVVALVLGGGGARGIAHLGVIKVLEAEKIIPDLIVGCSAGAYIGTLYAFASDSGEAERRLLAFTSSPGANFDQFRDLQAMTPLNKEEKGFFKTLRRVYKTGRYLAKTLFQESYVDPNTFGNNVDLVIPESRIEDAAIPLAIVATDLASGREVVLREGPVRLAVKASSAIAGVFPTVDYEGKALIDGGFVNKVPVEVALRLGADVVVAVDVSSEIADTQDLSRRGTSISVRANAIMAATLKAVQMRFADVVIRPDVKNVHWANFSAAPEIIPIGEEAASAKVREIRRAIARGKWRRLARLFRKVPGRKLRFEPIDGEPPAEKSQETLPSPAPNLQE